MAGAANGELSFDSLSKKNLSTLQAEQAGKKYDKAAQAKEFVARKRLQKEAELGTEPPPPAAAKGSKRRAADNGGELSASQIKIAGKAIDRVPSGDKQEAQRQSFIHRYELYHQHLPRDMLPHYVKGSANWTWREASYNYNAIRAHLNGSNRLEMGRELYFQVLGAAEHANQRGLLPLDLELDGMTQALRENKDQLETELTEMAVELSDLTPPTPWYIRLAIKTGQFAWHFSEAKKRAKLASELSEVPQ